MRRSVFLQCQQEKGMTDCQQIPWSGNEAYGKNLKLQMGRCPVRSLFPQALEILKKNQHLLG
jgi:hypothetical protein